MKQEIKENNEEKAKYFITSSNFKRLLYRSNIDSGDNILKTYSDVYESADLKPYISHKEIKLLNKELMFLQKTEEFLISLEKENKEKSKKNNITSGVSSDFLFVSGPPKYHINSECETLYKDFSNFQIPEEIKSRGQEEIEKFRKFASKNKKFLNEGKEDLFLHHLKTEFKLKYDVNKVLYENSGKTSIEVGEFDLDRIALKINKAIEGIEKIRTTEEGKKSIEAYLYASPNKVLKHDNLSPIDKELLEIKKDLLCYVSVYNVNKYASEGVEYTKSLLNLYGFEPCGKCCATFDLS